MTESGQENLIIYGYCEENTKYKIFLMFYWHERYERWMEYDPPYWSIGNFSTYWEYWGWTH